jgi:hypothetical protein
MNVPVRDELPQLDPAVADLREESPVDARIEKRVVMDQQRGPFSARQSGREIVGQELEHETRLDPQRAAASSPMRITRKSASEVRGLASSQAVLESRVSAPRPCSVAAARNAVGFISIAESPASTLCFTVGECPLAPEGILFPVLSAKSYHRIGSGDRQRYAQVDADCT